MRLLRQPPPEKCHGAPLHISGADSSCGACCPPRSDGRFLWPHPPSMPVASRPDNGAFRGPSDLWQHCFWDFEICSIVALLRAGVGLGLSLPFFPRCFPTGNPARRCAVPLRGAPSFEIMAVYISLDGHSVVKEHKASTS